MVPEEWNDGGVIVNWWEADVFMVHIPFELKVRNSCILNMYVYMYICWSVFVFRDLAEILADSAAGARGGVGGGDSAHSDP